MATVKKDEIIKDINKRISKFPPFPPIFIKILRVVDNPLSSAADIEKVLKYDQILASRVLKMANSAYYGYSGKISTISQGVVVLGLNTLRALIFTASASKMLNRKLLGYRLVEGEFWKHSVLTAIGARALAQKIKYPNVEEAFVAGLLHDIGKLVLDTEFVKLQPELLKLMREENLPLHEAEYKLLGVNHAHIGRRLVEQWNLPSVLVDSIAHHHNPQLATTNKILPSIVCLADNEAWKIMEEKGRAALSKDMLEENIATLKIPKAFLEDLESMIRNDFNNATLLLHS